MMIDCIHNETVDIYSQKEEVHLLISHSPWAEMGRLMELIKVQFIDFNKTAHLRISSLSMPNPTLPCSLSSLMENGSLF